MYKTLLVCLAVGLFACKKLHTTRPDCDTQAVVIPQDTSFLSTPLVIPTRLITEKLNRAIKQDILNDQDFDSLKKNGKKDHLKMKVTRLGEIQVHWKNNVATYSAPLLVLIERQIVPKRLLALPKSLAIKTEFSLRVAFETTIDIGEDWQVQPKTRFKSFEWLSEVKALGGLIDIKNMVERRLDRQMPQVLVNLDSTIQANIHLDRSIGRIWRNIQKPIRVNKKEELVWLKIHPIRFEMGNITSDSANLLIQGRLYATTETVFGEKPAPDVDSILPRLVKRESLPDEAFVYLLSNISYTDINKIIERQFAGKSFDVPGHRLTIKSAEIWGCGQNLMLHLRVRGDVRGDIYLQGTPTYEPDSQRLEIRDFEFEVHTEEALLASADWLLHDTFKEKVKAALSIELGDKIAKIPTAIMEGIERGKAGKKMEFTLEDWSFKPQKIWVRPGDLAALVLVHARARIELEQL